MGRFLISVCLLALMGCSPQRQFDSAKWKRDVWSDDDQNSTHTRDEMTSSIIDTFALGTAKEVVFERLGQPSDHCEIVNLEEFIEQCSWQTHSNAQLNIYFTKSRISGFSKKEIF
jgi:hypothetical protein